MAAADDYPYFANWVERCIGFSAGQQEKDALAEIDSLREANAFLQTIIDDALPSVVIDKPAVMKIDGRWMRVLTDSKDL